MTGASAHPVDLLTGMMFTDQGPIVGRAHESARRRADLAPEVEIWGGAMVKHATAPPGLDIGQAAGDTVARALAAPSSPGRAPAPSPTSTRRAWSAR